MKKKSKRPKFDYEHRVFQASVRSKGVGYVVREVRGVWCQSQFEFGIMLGQGLLSAIVVDRWERGLESVPRWLWMWIIEQWDEVKRLRRRGCEPLVCRDPLHRWGSRPVVCPSARDAMVGFGRMGRVKGVEDVW